MTINTSSSRKGNKRRFALAMAIIFVPATLLLGSVGLDRAGYCVASILPGNATLETEPYVQNVTRTSASLVWRTLSTAPATIEFRKVGDAAFQPLALEPAEIHISRLTGLEPGTEYEYRVALRLETVTGSFQTAPDASEPVVIGVIGDSGTKSKAQFAIAALLEEADLDLLLHTGDVVYQRGGLCHYGPKYFDPYGAMIRTVPVYPVLGNHDYKAANGEAWFETFDLPANNPAHTEAYYSFDYGPVHIVALDSEAWNRGNATEIAAQLDWLENDLAGSAQPWTIVTLHRPPFSSSDKHQGDEEIRGDLGPVFERYQVDLVLSGHAHSYERFLPQNGVTYIVTGGGGGELHGLDPGDQTAASAKEHHFLRIEASETSLVIIAINQDGQEIDRSEMPTS